MDYTNFDAIILQFESLSREDLVNLVRKSVKQAVVCFEFFLGILLELFKSFY
jgi:hypothetical protein